MPILSLHVNNFRNLSDVEIVPCPIGLNIIDGQNGSGKTSLLESIYYLGSGRSFRSSNPTRLIKKDCEKFCLFTQLLSENECDVQLGIERDIQGNSRSRIGEKEGANIAELASYLPIRIINSQSHHLFESGPIF